MSTSWSAPDERQVMTGTAFGRSYEQVVEPAPPLRTDVAAAVVTVIASVLAATPIGLLWAHLAPRVDVTVSPGADGPMASLVDVYGDGRIAADAYFLAAVALAGALGGALAWLLGRRHGPAVVTALAVGGLLAAWTVMEVGQSVGMRALRERLDAGGEGTVELTVKLSSPEAVVAWPVVSLLVFLLLSVLLDRRREAKAAALSSG